MFSTFIPKKYYHLHEFTSFVSCFSLTSSIIIICFFTSSSTRPEFHLGIRMMKSSRHHQSIEDEIVTTYLKMMMMIIDNNGNVWPRHFLRSQDVYCKNPSTLFDTQNPWILYDGRYFFVNRSVNSGKTDGCDESGCWRVMGRDKLIKSEKTGKILGFKKVYKFCEKEKPKSMFKFWEKEKRRVRDKRIWVMEEYRLASQWKQGYVICRIRLLYPNTLEFMLCNHIRGYYI